MHSRVLAELLCLEKTCEGFIVRQDNCWLYFFPQDMCKLKKRHLFCQKLSFEYMENLSCAGRKISEPNGTEAYVFRFDCIFWSGLSSIMRASLTLLTVASVIKTRCLPGMGCFNATWQASLRALLTESNVSFNSDVILNGTSVLSAL